MNPFKELLASEIAAMLAILTMLGGGLVWLINKHFSGIFVSKKAYYAQRDDDAKVAHEIRAKNDADAKEYRDKVLEEMEGMNRNLSSFMEKIAEWKGDFQTRVKVLEDREDRASRRRRGGSGR